MNEPNTIHLLGKNEPLARVKESDGLFEGLHTRKRPSHLSPEIEQPRTKKSVTTREKRPRKVLSDSQLMYLRLLFDELDPNSSGKVTLSRYLNQLINRHLADPSILTHIKSSDTPKSLSELLFSLSPLAQFLQEDSPSSPSAGEKVLSKVKIAEYKRLFDMLDKNCSGGLDEEELFQGLEYHSQADVKDMMSKYDFDKNKELQFFEFLKMIAPEGVRVPSSLEEEYRRSSISGT